MSLVLGGLAAVAAPRAVDAATAPLSPGAATGCFGGVAKEVASGQGGPQSPAFVGHRLFWQASGGLRVQEMSGQAPRDVARGFSFQWVTDGQAAFGTNQVNQIVGIDLPQGKARPLIDQQAHMNDPLIFSSIGLDHDFVYFGQASGILRGAAAAGFFRVARGGGPAPERLAPQPDGNTAFVVEDGFVYWIARGDGASLVRRALRKDAPLQTLAALTRPYPLVRLAEGRVFVLDEGVIKSVPRDGQGEVIAHVRVGGTNVTDLVADGACVYWSTHQGTVFRAPLAGGPVERAVQVAPLVGVYSQPPRVLATDGDRLIVTDVQAGKVLSLERSAAAATPATIVAARVLTGPEQPPPDVGVNRLVVFDQGGCARLFQSGAYHWQCWSAAPAGPIRAHRVPGLVSDAYVAGPDGLCGLENGQLRCHGATDLAKPALAGGAPADNHPTSRYAPLPFAVGGTFRCARGAGGWGCTGDDGFGQLAHKPQEDSTWLLGASVTLGTWHGCAWDASAFRCWGRNDHGQAGGEGPVVAAPRALPFPVPGGSGLLAAGTFTCYHRGLVACWGASRDGLFGTADECPAELKTAFPTLAGPVAAPNATCARTPTPIPLFAGPSHPLSLTASPRAICGFMGGGPLRCTGAAPAPDLRSSGDKVLALSPGDRLNGCVAINGMGGADVQCWGESYTRGPLLPDVTPQTVAIALDTGGQGATIVVDGTPDPRKSWASRCGIQRSCVPGAAALPPCARDTLARAQTVEELFGHRDRAAGPVVARGPLLVRTDGLPADIQVSATCDPAPPYPVVLGQGAQAVRLDGLSCDGDTSRRCCPVPADGRAVIVEGQMTEQGGEAVIRAPRLCRPIGPQR